MRMLGVAEGRIWVGRWGVAVTGEVGWRKVEVEFREKLGFGGVGKRKDTFNGVHRPFCGSCGGLSSNLVGLETELEG